ASRLVGRTRGDVRAHQGGEPPDRLHQPPEPRVLDDEHPAIPFPRRAAVARGKDHPGVLPPDRLVWPETKSLTFERGLRHSSPKRPREFHKQKGGLQED